MSRPRIGTAGWSLPAKDAEHFPGPGTHLQRYARALGAVEINSSFHRPHKRETYARWAASVGDGFLFSVKLPKTISHERRLADCHHLVGRFLEETQGLDDKLGVYLLQLPPTLRFDAAIASRFIEDFQAMTTAPLVCEPRHACWWDAERWLIAREIGRVAADPPPFPGAGNPGGWKGIAYRRLHGRPAIYRSNYEREYLDRLAEQLCDEPEGMPSWTIFDNTTLGFALGNALSLAGGVSSRL